MFLLISCKYSKLLNIYNHEYLYYNIFDENLKELYNKLIYAYAKGKIMIKKILGIAVLFGLMMTAAQAKTFLVDVRTPSEIATTGKVEGALVANYSAPDFVDQFKALGAKPDDDIELYCRSGRRAEMASQILSKLGYKNIRNLGGYEAAAETLKRPLVK